MPVQGITQKQLVTLQKQHIQKYYTKLTHTIQNDNQFNSI